jgi:glycosidase
MDDFKHFLSEAHKRGIRVIIDLVINHTSSQNPWFKAALDPKSPYRGWYIFSPTDPGYTGPWKQQVWHPSPGASDFFYGAFSDQMPDLNLKNPAVTAEIQDVVKFWLKDVGVDGFRLDAVPYYIEEGSKQNDTASTHQWLQAFRQFYKSQSPEAVTVGEVMESSFSAIPYAAGQTQLDMVFNFELAERIIQAVYGGAGQSAASGMAYSNQEFAAKKAGYGAFLSNHDQNRVMARFGLDTAKAKSAAVLYLTGPGTPFIYYGEEIGMDGSKPDESIRTPMQWSAQKNGGFTSGTPWEALNANFLQFNAADESTDPQSLLTLYRKLVHLRLQHSALRSGTFLAVTADNPAVYAVLRASSDETILVLCNLGSEAVENVTLKLDQGSLKPGTYRLVPLLGDGTASPLNVNKQGGFDSYQPLGTLPAHASLVLQLQAGK